MTKTTGNISEVFASIQGEGLYIGTMQLFIRLAGCNLNCKRCELKEFKKVQDYFNIKPWPGLRCIRLINPITPQKLFDTIEKRYNLKDFYSISILGGEPLLQKDFLAEFLAILRSRKLPIFVETNGMLPNEFLALNDLVDYWCIDLKISKSWGFNGKLRKGHEKILAAAKPSKTYFRMLLDSNDDAEAILKQLKGLSTKRFNVVLQPFACAPSHVNDWDTVTILEWIKLFKPYFKQVRWIPQVHKLLRII